MSASIRHNPFEIVFEAGSWAALESLTGRLQQRETISAQGRWDSRRASPRGLHWAARRLGQKLVGRIVLPLHALAPFAGRFWNFARGPAVYPGLTPQQKAAREERLNA